MCLEDTSKKAMLEAASLRLSGIYSSITKLMPESAHRSDREALASELQALINLATAIGEMRASCGKT